MYAPTSHTAVINSSTSHKLSHARSGYVFGRLRTKKAPHRAKGSTVVAGQAARLMWGSVRAQFIFFVTLVRMAVLSWRTTFSRELWTTRSPL